MDSHHFRNPPKEYREVPFWSWNDDLDPVELRRQVTIMDEAGWGGFFMHARVGLKTRYLGQRWMECIKACVDEARQRGMGAWLYDEDKWPSGFAGGLSVSKDPSYRMQYLVCKVDNRPALLPERIATFAAREVNGVLQDIHADPNPTIPTDEHRLIQFYPQTLYLGIPWFNDYCYLSLINPKAVRAFLETTHDAYAGVVGSDFGTTIPGIFTDEPAYTWRGGGRGAMPTAYIPWTRDFPTYFQAKRGYDLLPKLPAIFFDTDDYHAVRYDYWRTLTELFVESYMKQIYSWCEEHKIAATGHMMAEDTLLSQIEWIGAAMPHYPYFHIPGIDKLGRIINTGPGTILTVKQLDSAVCQLGKPRALCENYGCSGQDFAHTGRKWIGDWAYVLGITLNNPHLSLYTLRGERKRDYPQNIFYQQPWWPENNLIADYFARLSYVLSQGQRVVDILVVHPIGSAWSVYRPGSTRAVDQLDRPLNDLLTALMQNQRDFHLGDELLMDKGGACEAKVVKDGDSVRLVVGKMSYRVIVVPPGITLAENTVRVLHEFAAAGGVILALEPLPTMINARPTDKSVLPATARIVTIGDLPAVLDSVLPFDVRVPNHPAIWVHHRRIEGKDIYFLANTDQDHGGVATIYLHATGHLEEWDPASGQVHTLPVRQENGMSEVVLDFPPVGSHLLVLDPAQPPSATLQPAKPLLVGEIMLGSTWQIVGMEPNALTLDTPEVQIGDGEWSKPMHILDAHGAIARAGVGTPFALRFTFAADTAPASPVYLIVESPERFTFTVNGAPVANGDEGWWVDTSFRKINLGATIRAGRNEIILRGGFTRDSELESVYLVGQFGVQAHRLREESRFNGQIFDRYTPNFRLTALPNHVGPVAQQSAVAIDLTQHGLAFYAGRVTLRQTLALTVVPRKAQIEIGNLRAALAHVRINGKEIGAVAWQPHVVDIADGLLRVGSNTVEIELVGTLRNLLGPHHLNGGDQAWTGPAEFRDKQRWTDDYILVPFGFDRVTLRMFES